MSFSIKDNLLIGAIQKVSPNCSQRGNAEQIDLLIIHNISLPPGEFETGYVEQLFCNKLSPKGHPYFAEISHLKVSSHLFISRAGEVTQFVPFDKKAWHAGESTFDGKENCNEFSIGIELEGTDYERFTDIQYKKLIIITNLLIQKYPGLNSRRIVGHSDVSPGRKTDPGPYFEWDNYRKFVN